MLFFHYFIIFSNCFVGGIFGTIIFLSTGIYGVELDDASQLNERLERILIAGGGQTAGVCAFVYFIYTWPPGIPVFLPTALVAGLFAGFLGSMAGSMVCAYIYGR